jgi:hypothetical protein
MNMELLAIQLASLIRQYGAYAVREALDQQIAAQEDAETADEHIHGPACYDYWGPGYFAPLLVCPIRTRQDEG